MELSIGGESVLVDEADWNRVCTVEFACGMFWRARPCDMTWRLKRKSHTSYVVCTLGAKFVLMLHRCVLDAPRNSICDHINNNGMDNRRCNLRIVTTQQNSWNSRKLRLGSSRFKGVCRDAKSGKYRAHIRVNGKKKHLGSFTSEVDAAEAYNRAAVSSFGEFAKINSF